MYNKLIEEKIKPAKEKNNAIQKIVAIPHGQHSSKNTLTDPQTKEIPQNVMANKRGSFVSQFSGCLIML